MRDRIGVCGGVVSLLAAVLATCQARAQDWSERNKGKLRPPAREGHAMAYDAARQRVVLFGGAAYGRIFSDTWEWDGNTWTHRIPATSPSARGLHAMAYDTARKRVVLFGGSGVQGALNDTWEWDGNTWTRRHPVTSPSARYWHAMAYDAARRRVVLFGGSAPDNSTWEWDGKNWMRRRPVTSPSARGGHAMAYDASRKRVVMFGGFGVYGKTKTWEWDGTNWTPRQPAASPPGRNLSAMAYDASRQRIVLFAGYTAPVWTNDTWEWDGSTWTRRWPATSPSRRVSHAMVYDPSRQRVVLFGGKGLGAAVNDTWEYGFPATVAISGSPRPGGTVSLVLTAAGDAGLPYQAGSSLGTGPIPVGSRRIHLSPDDLLRVSVAGLWPWVFPAYQGVLDRRGQASAAIHIPSVTALVGTRVHTAFLTLDPPAPSGIRSISSTQSFTIAR